MKAINPATEELIRDYAEPSEAEIEDRLQRAQHAFSSWRTTSFADRSRLMERAAQLLRRAAHRVRPPHDRGDGQADRRGRGRDRQVRLGLRVLRRARRALPRPDDGPDRGLEELRPLRPARARAGGHAVELSLLAGLPLRRPGADGRQRGAPQARGERAAAAPWPSRKPSARPASRRAC